jgi:hypothetical protein
MTSACTLPCVLEGPRCMLFGLRALLIAECPEDRDRLAATLRLLGLEVLTMASSGCGAAALPARIDLIVGASLADLSDAAGVVALLRDERPWVPLIAATAAAHAVRVDLDRGLSAPAPAHRAGDLATLVVRAVCRAARHSRVAAAPGATTRAPPPAG